jgi:hypothetical protein
MSEFEYLDTPYELLDDGVYEFVGADVDITSAVCAALHGGHYRTWRRTMDGGRRALERKLAQELPADLAAMDERYAEARRVRAELIDIEPEPDDDEADDFTGE